MPTRTSAVCSACEPEPTPRFTSGSGRRSSRKMASDMFDVVVLARVDDVLAHASLGERVQHRRELHEVGARANDVEDVFHD